ncbi:MAG: sigma factor, partial [Planctomycetota bacterium]
MTDLTARTDGELLREFARTRAGEPFAEMVRRHGAMVHGVCRRVAGRDDLAEDAANAAFLVLARKAAAVGSRPDAGGWLHRVADHVARRARDAERRRAFHERRAAAMKTAGDGIEAVDREEILRNVDAALGTLRGGERA